jgi:Arm DNA-binding domain
MGITLTRQTVAGLTKPGIYFDDQIRGFGCRVRLHADGKVRKTFIMQYRIDGRQRRQKIPTNNIDVARKKAEQMHAQIVLGTDPALKKETERASTVLKFSRAVEQYLDLKKTDLRPTSLRLATLYLTRPQYFGQMHAMR